MLLWWKRRKIPKQREKNVNYSHWVTFKKSVMLKIASLQHATTRQHRVSTCHIQFQFTTNPVDPLFSEGTRDDLSLCSLPLSISECSNATNHRLSAQNVADPVWCVVENTAPESRSSDYTSCSSESSCCLDTLQADIYSPAARSKLRFSFSSSASEDFVRTNVVDTTDVNQKISCFKTEPAWNDIDRHFNSPSRVYNVVDLNHIPTTVTSIFPVLTGQLFRQRKSLTEASRGILIDSKKNRRLRADPVQRFKQYQMLWQYDKYGDSSISSST